MPNLRTRVLDIDYEDRGPADGAVVLLLHGWPDDASTWAQIAPVLNAAGLRTVTPSLRGFGRTRFLDPATPRTGDAAVLAQDAIDLLDGLSVGAFAVAGHDWGSNTAEALAVGWPERVNRIAMLSSPPRLGEVLTPPFWWARLQWYHWFQATARGAEAVRADPEGFARIMWDTWSPPGWYDPATFDRVARAFANPDWVEVTLHSYRSRWGEAEPDPNTGWLTERLRATASLQLPALYLHGSEDSVNPPKTAVSVPAKFQGDLRSVLLDGVGHFATREAPETVSAELLDFFRPNSPR